jgi:hypothetical protein
MVFCHFRGSKDILVPLVVRGYLVILVIHVYFDNSERYFGHFRDFEGILEIAWIFLVILIIHGVFGILEVLEVFKLF